MILEKQAKEKIRQLDIALLEHLYKVHLRIRYLHDNIYERDGWYKKYSDKPIASKINKGVVFSFLTSLIIYQFLALF